MVAAESGCTETVTTLQNAGADAKMKDYKEQMAAYLTKNAEINALQLASLEASAQYVLK